MCSITTRTAPKIAAKEMLSITLQTDQNSLAIAFKGTHRKARKRKEINKIRKNKWKTNKNETASFFKTTLPIIKALYINDLNMPIKIQRLSE